MNQTKTLEALASDTKPASDCPHVPIERDQYGVICFSGTAYDRVMRAPLKHLLERNTLMAIRLKSLRDSDGNALV